VSRDASVANPVDLVASASAEVYEHAVRTVLADPGIDALVVIFVPPLVTRPDDVAAAIDAGATGAGDKPVVACFLGRQGVPPAARDADPRRRQIPSFPFPESAAAALARAAEHSEWLARPVGTVPDLPDVDIGSAREIVAAALRDHDDGVWLDPDRAAELCACFGIPVAALERAMTPDDAAAVATKIGFPVALKAASGAIVHKSDVGAVHLGLGSPEAVRDAFNAMAARLGDEMGGGVVQAMVRPGVETIVGITHDPSFGPLVLFGMGGTAAELLRDTALRIVPITDVDAHEVVRSLKTSPMLTGYRGAPPVDIGALEDVVVRIGRLADTMPEVTEMDCNPVIVSPEGAAVVDVRVRLTRPQVSPLRGLRRMRSI
jgi:acyl-CoA synthetase (NDP forming)